MSGGNKVKHKGTIRRLRVGEAQGINRRSMEIKKIR
jgi:hypothetical protein